MMIQRYALLCALILALLGCVGMPKIEKPQFTQRHYTYSVLLAPEKLGKSHQLELALSLLRMEYPADQAEALHTLLYAQASPDEYKEVVVNEQRKNYRSRAAEVSADKGNWRYAERYNIRQTYERAIVIERNFETYSGSAQSGIITQYYNIEIIDIDGNELRQLTLDDLFADFQEDQQCRDIVYGKLREYNNLGSAQPLSQGIYFNNQPELTFNFFITDEGLGLHWDPAQIAPPSHGSIQVILPWSVIQPLMLITGIETLAKFDIHLFELRSDNILEL